MKIFSCLCVCDSLFNMTNDQIVKMYSTISDLSVDIITIEKEDNLYICCRDTIIFCYELHNDDDFVTCETIFDPVSCFDLISYGFHDICITCTESLINKDFFDNLVKVKGKKNASCFL